MKLNIVKPFLPTLSELSLEFSSSLSSGLVTNGSQFVRDFELKLGDFFTAKFKPTVYCNGEMGLYHLIQAWKHKLGYSPHDTFEVLVPSFTFSGTINAIVQNNLKPVFCDVDDGYVLDMNKIQKDSRDIRIILPVGAYGNLVDLDVLSSFCNQNDVVAILDNAPAFGSRFNSEFPNKWGHSEMISLHATKIFSSMEGGVNIVNDTDIQAYLERLRDYGQYEKQRGNIDIPGLNSKMQEISAIVGLKNLEKVDYILGSRKKNVEKYKEGLKPLVENGYFEVMNVNPKVECTYLYFPILLQQNAGAFVQFMADHEIAVRRYYTATHRLDYYNGKYRNQDLSYTEDIKDRIVSLPIHTEMSDSEIQYLINTITKYFKK